MTDPTPTDEELAELAEIEGWERSATPGPWSPDEPFEVHDNGTTVSWVTGPGWWYDGSIELHRDPVRRA